MATKIVHIDWIGPFKVDEVIKKKTDEKKDCGIYQIYGNHPIYGPNSLLYIGKTVNQTFSDRIKAHLYDWLRDSDYAPVTIYLGDVYHQQGEVYDKSKDFLKDEWLRHTELCEQLLIYALGPSYNTQNKESIQEMKLRDLHILNWGSRAALPPEVSGDRWTYKYGKE